MTRAARRNTRAGDPAGSRPLQPGRQPAPADLPRQVAASCLRLSAAYVKALTEQRPHASAAALSIAGGLAVYAGVGSPMTRALGLGMAGPVAETDLARVETFFTSRGVPVEVVLLSAGDPALPGLLERRGYQAIGHRSLFVRAPGSLPPAPRCAADLRIVRVARDTFPIWLETVARGFPGEEAAIARLISAYGPMIGMPEITCVLALIGTSPVGGAAVGCADGVANLFAAATLPAFRGRGVHTALLRERLAIAAGAGCALAALDADAGSPSRRNAESAGFAAIATQTTMVLDPRGGSEMLLRY